MMVEVDIDYLHALEEDSKIMEALRIVGVSNWEGYELAQAILDEE